MTLGENIRRIRKERHLTIKQLVGVSESYMRAYEVGDRHPKADRIEAIAIALGVNPETLQNSEFDSIRAMHRLFQIFRQYSGELKEMEDDTICISFESLNYPMSCWYKRYMEYQYELLECDKIKDPIERADRLVKTENAFLLWMDNFPEGLPDPNWADHTKQHDAGMDYIGLHPLNDPENPMTEAEKQKHNQKAKELFNGKRKSKKQN